jgi:hypothetical protein
VKSDMTMPEKTNHVLTDSVSTSSMSQSSPI